MTTYMTHQTPEELWKEIESKLGSFVLNIVKDQCKVQTVPLTTRVDRFTKELDELNTAIRDLNT